MEMQKVNPDKLIWREQDIVNEMKWNESGFRPPLCTYRLNWARRTSWGWWDDWDDTVLQTQDSKFEPWRSEAEHATSRSRSLPTILTFTRGWGRNIFVSFKQDIVRTRQSEGGGILREQAAQQTHDIVEMLFWFWANVWDDGSGLKQHCILYLLGYSVIQMKTRRCFNLLTAGTGFRRLNLTSIDVRFWRLNTISTLEAFKIYNQIIDVDP